MNLFRRLLGQKETKDSSAPSMTAPQEMVADQCSEDAVRPKTLPSAELELLQQLTRRAVDSRLAEVWNGITGPLENSIANFVQENLLTEAPLIEKLGQKYRVVDLKPLLARYEVKAKGKKADLLTALVGAAPADELAKLVVDLKLYKATATGQQKIDAYLEEKRHVRESMEADTLAALRRGDATQAASIIARYESQQLFPRGMGIDWSHGMPEDYIEQASYLLEYIYDDLPYSEEQRREIGVQLALSELLSENLGEAAKRVLIVTNGEFTCASLVKFIRTNPDGIAMMVFDTDNPAEVPPQKLAAVYLRTKQSEVYAERELKELRKHKFGTGITILTANDDHVCRKCNESKGNHRWSEKLPKIPHHWGCRCSYSLWFES